MPRPLFPPYPVAPTTVPTRYGSTLVTPRQQLSTSWGEIANRFVAAPTDDLGKVSRNSHLPQKSWAKQPVEIFAHIARVIGFVERIREIIQQCIVLRLVTGL